MRFERLSIEEGLSQSVVNCILQDRLGFMWFGTQDGLNRYDGYRFEIYRHDLRNPASLTHDWVTALAEDPTGDLWVGTEGGGVSRWQRATDSFAHYRHDPTNPASLSGHRVIAMTWDGAGALWIATLDAGLNRLDPRTGVSQRFQHDPSVAGSLAHDQLGAAYVDRQGTLWVGTWDGLDRFDSATGTFSHFRYDSEDPRSLSDNRVRAIVEDDRARLWIGTRHGLNRFEPDGEDFERFLHDPTIAGSLSHNWVRALFEDSDGRLWIGTDGGLNLWREGTAGFASYRQDAGDPESLGSDLITHVLEDRSGLLWIGTLGGGIGKWNPSTWSFLHYRTPDEDGASRNVFAISEDEDHRLWLGTLGGGLEQLDRRTGQRRRYLARPGDDSSLSDNRVTALLHDREGTLWIGTVGGGLGRLARGSESFESYRHDRQRPDSLSNDAVTALFLDRQARLWIGTWTGGLNLYRGDDTFRRFRHDPNDPHSLGSDRIFSLTEDPRGRLWIATVGGGLNRLDLTPGLEPPTGPRSALPVPSDTTFLRLTHDPDDPTGLSDSEVAVVHIDGSGRLWVGTKNSGLDKLESLDEDSQRAIFRNYSPADGLPDGSIWGILTDASGHLWLSTNGGLSRFDPEAETFKNFDTSHGLQSLEFNQGAYYQSPSGELLFGGVEGFNAFFPERIKSNTVVPPVVLTGLSRFNQPMIFDRPLFDVNELTLSHRDYLLAFEFAALDFTAPRKNRYRYRLEGFDDAWVDLGTERRVTFANLDPGRYMLRVQGSNNDGVWNEEGASIRIAVAPPPWLSWWAYSTYALAVAIALTGIFRLQRRRLERQKQEELEDLDRKRREEELAAAESWALALVEKNVEVEEKNQQILSTQTQLVQSEKMAALGQMVAGVAHEINNPVNFISSGLPSLRRDVDKLAAMVPIDHHDEHFDKVSRRVAKLFEAIGDGARRTAETVRDLRSFARLDEAELKVANLHAALDTTLALLLNQTKNRIDVVKSYGEIPPVECYVGQLNQVFMNLLLNAVQAIEGEGTIVITTTRRGDDHVRISIRDSGGGMTEDVKAKVFDPFFTTKPVGQGTGLGLSISHGIVDRHRGTIRIESQPGEGTEFTITLPIHHASDQADRAPDPRAP